MGRNDLSRRLVVVRNDPKKILRVVRRKDNVGLLTWVLSVRSITGNFLQTEFTKDQKTQFSEVKLVSGPFASGITLEELIIPCAAVKVSIRRGYILSFSHVYTCHREGDPKLVLSIWLCIEKVMAAFSEQTWNSIL